MIQQGEIDPNRRGRQEMIENLINMYIYRAALALATTIWPSAIPPSPGGTL